MTTDERSGFCAHCQRHVLGRRPGVNHVLHAIISIKLTGDDNPGNLLYLLIVAGGFVGAIVSRFQPHGLARVMAAMAAAQAAVPVIAVLLWRNDFAPGVYPVFVLNSFWVAMFAGSAWLFHHAARHANGPGVAMTA